jgi:hypothetical protein
MKISFIAIICCLVLSCNVSKKETQKVNAELVERNRVSNDTVENLRLSFKKKDYQMFFDFFPSSYGQFLGLYGFDDKNGAKPLYEVYEDHVNYFFEFEGHVDQKEFIKKIYGIVKNAIWEADAPTILQDNLTLLIIKSPKAILSLLSTKPNKEVESFWFFVFDGSSTDDLQNKEKFKNVYGKINALNPKQADLLKQVFGKMYNGKDSHKAED